MFEMLGLTRSIAQAPRERRRAERVHVHAAAEIVLSVERTLTCIAVNISASGAMLKLPRPALLPGTFEIRVPSRKLRRNARIVWREGEQVGVHFI